MLVTRLAIIPLGIALMKTTASIPLEKKQMVIGDWFKLTAGKPVEMEVLIGECPGGLFSCELMIEQEGVEYKKVPYKGGMRPVLPVFKMVNIPDELAAKMKIDPNAATIDGPSFGPTK